MPHICILHWHCMNSTNAGYDHFFVVQIWIYDVGWGCRIRSFFQFEYETSWFSVSLKRPLSIVSLNVKWNKNHLFLFNELGNCNNSFYSKRGKRTNCRRRTTRRRRRWSKIIKRVLWIFSSLLITRNCWQSNKNKTKTLVIF